MMSPRVSFFACFFSKLSYKFVVGVVVAVLVACVSLPLSGLSYYHTPSLSLCVSVCVVLSLSLCSLRFLRLRGPSSAPQLYHLNVVQIVSWRLRLS